MATSIFANPASADRRKKVVTYGKSLRAPTTATLAPASQQEVPPLQRPRKQVAASFATSNTTGGQSKPAVASAYTRAKSTGPDPFDVPSEDEFIMHVARPTKRLPTKQRVLEDDYDVPLSDEEVHSQKPAKKAIPALRKPALARPADSPAKPLKQPARSQIHAQNTRDMARNPITLQTQRAKTPQPIPKPTHQTRHASQVQRPSPRAKSISRSTTPGLPAPRTSNTTKISNSTTTTALSRGPTKQLVALDVFDMPMSDDEKDPPQRKSLPKGPKLKRKEIAPLSGTATTLSRQNETESDDSAASRKRKRQKSVSSLSNVKPSTEQRCEPSVSRQNRKEQKKEKDDLSHKVTFGEVDTNHIAASQLAEPAAIKTSRTRQRTIPLLAQPTMVKGQSSPAILDRMLPRGTTSRPTLSHEAPDITALDDETMYEVSDAMATPMRSTKTTTSGSVTPRQKAMFSGLLGGSSLSNTPLPRLSALKLTEQTPRSRVDVLSRSKSDVTHSPQIRPSKLISTLRQAESSSEDDEEGSADDGEETDSPTSETHIVPRSAAEPQQVGSLGNSLPQDMDAEHEIVVDSQSSQATSMHGARPRFTYAKSRSYLQEANPEDAFLMSMDLDDDLGIDSQKKLGFSDDEDDPSQAQAYHELKRQGQQNLFNDDAQMLMDDTSKDKSTSIRRSAMLELCTKMESGAFTGQLLDSSWAHDLIKNMSSGGEAIFDFATAVAIIYIVRTKPSYSIVHELFCKDMMTMLVKLIEDNADIRKIAKERKTNLSRIAQESVTTFRNLVERSIDWCPGALDKVTPQLVSLKALDVLLTDLHKGGTNEALLDQESITSLVDLAASLSGQLGSGAGSNYNTVVLDLVLSILQTVSVTPQKQAAWGAKTLQRLADSMPSVFTQNHAASTMMAMKICMNLSNNKPKACQSFSGAGFIRALVSSITHRFGMLRSPLKEQQRIEIVDTLILSLGAMINLAEYSDEARKNVDDGQQLISALVTSFVTGSERAANAESLEESHSGVAVGYLGVLLGNLCLNRSVRAKIRVLLPDKRLDMIVDKIKEFIQVHEHANMKASQIEGAESQETWHNYTARLMIVVDNLEKVEA